MTSNTATLTAVSARPDTGRTVAGDAERVQSAIEYLLISNLNAQTSPQTGPVSNQRLVQLFLTLLARTNPSHFFDVGANDGSTALRVKQMLPRCSVTAFEANPVIHAFHREELSSHNVRSLNLAVAARRGQVTLYAPTTLSKAFVDGEVVSLSSVEPANTGKSSVLKRDEAATYDEHVVEAVSLDDVLPEAHDAGRGVALWIDVEGLAYEVLCGAGAMLARTSVVFIETENHQFWAGQKQCPDVARLLIAAGFIPIARDREYGDKQFNTVFIHNSLAELVYPQSYAIDQKAGQAAPAAPPATAWSQGAASPTPAKTRYRSLTACLAAEIPVFVPVFNNPTYAANMLQQLKGRGVRTVVLVDNASTSNEMHRFLDQADATVIGLPDNKGPHDLFNSDPNFTCLPEIFCVTDPDLQFGPDMPPDFIFDLLTLTNTLGVGKAGLALDISEPDLMTEKKFHFGDRAFHVWEWESQFWRDQVGALPDGSPVYKANIDTTFAVYNKRHFRRETFYDAVRVAGRYTCRHLPWYRSNGLTAEEDGFYRATQRFSYHMR